MQSFRLSATLSILAMCTSLHQTFGLLPTPPGLDKGFNLLETTSKFLPQGNLVKGAKESWKFIWQRMMAELAPQSKKGSYERPSYASNGIIGSSEFPDEKGRYHLYLGNPCPWCHRVKLAVALKKLGGENIGQTRLVDDPVKASRGGWVFSKADKDPLGSYDLRELYEKLSPGYKGRCTAPLLVDLKAQKIVSNESSDIVRMLNTATLGKEKSDIEDCIDLYDKNLASKIDETNEWVYELLNNGVYRCGFSTQQNAYDQASADVKLGLERANEILSENDYLCGNHFTEADLRLLPTILRFDGAYSPLFRAGGVNKRIRDYPYLMQWLQRCWAINGIKESIDLQDAVSSYYKQLFPLNPGGLLPTPITEEEIGLHQHY